MRWFLDTEFDDNGKTIELISLGLVSEVGHSYYAVSNEFDPERCSPWLKQNVLPSLGTSVRSERVTIALNVRDQLLAHDEVAEVWTYFGSYDWVVLCQLYGRMVDLPKGFPFWHHELKQLMEDCHLSLDDLPKQNGVKHHALADAAWVRDAYLWISDRDRAGSDDGRKSDQTRLRVLMELMQEERRKHRGS